MAGPTPIQAARQRILSHFPRFSPLFLRLEIQVLPDTREAFITDDLRVGLGDQNLKNIAVGAGTIMHELCHALFDHFRRRGNREPKRWNAATDIAINELLERMFKEVGGGKFSTEPDWYFARTFNLTFGTVIPKAEDIYDMLAPYAQQIEAGDMRACGTGAGNSHPMEGQLTPRAEPKTYEQVQIAIDQTMNEIRTAGGPVGNARGGLPGTGFAEFDMWKGMKPRESKTRWQDHLDVMVGLEISSVFGRNWVENWRIPNRRGVDYIPGAETIIPDVTVIADTSGSMARDGETVLGEVAAIITAQGPTRVLTVDTRVASDTIVSTVEEFLIAARGGGGTDMTPGLDEAGDGVIICITDGELGQPRNDRVDDVIWVITRKGYSVPSWMRKVVLAYE